ncbi:MAG TPA: GFA family protein [Usitatibacteraceae bacterium]|nr:GFA family protein [Usitatibacteraceae bacterium]
MEISGSCHCGRVAFTAVIDQDKVVACHCRDCQILSGAPFRTVAEASAASLRVQGIPKTYAFVQHGNTMEQAFCPECGTHLYASNRSKPNSVIIRLGCVDQRAKLAPTLQIWKESAMPWLDGLASIPAPAIPVDCDATGQDR